MAVEYASGNASLTSNAQNNQWYSVKIGLNVDGRKLDLWLDGAAKGNELHVEGDRN